MIDLIIIVTVTQEIEKIYSIVKFLFQINM